MTRPSFPALGFDPTPGELDAVQTSMVRVQKALVMVGETSERLTAAVQLADDWDGDAAEEFADHGDDLPMGLSKGAESMAKVAEALAKWSSKMAVNQATADNLEERAKRLEEQYEAAKEAEVGAAAAIPRDVTNPHYAARHADFVAATGETTSLFNRLEAVREEARRLAAKHLSEANETAEGIRGGPDDEFTPENDGWLVQATDGVAEAADWASLGLGAVSGALAATGIGLPVAAVTEIASSLTGAVGSAAGVGQQLLHSRHAPGWTLAGIGVVSSLIPGGGTAAAAARQTLKVALKGGSKAAVRGALKELNTAVKAGSVPTAVRNAKGIREHGLSGKASRELTEAGRDVAKRRGIYGDLPQDLAARKAALQQLGLAEKQREGMVSAIDHSEKIADKAGVEFTPEDKRALAGARLALNPKGSQIDSEIGGVIDDRIGGK